MRQPRPGRLQLHRGQGRVHALGEGVDRRLRAGVRALHRHVPHVALQHQGDSLAGSLLRPREPSRPVRIQPRRRTGDERRMRREHHQLRHRTPLSTQLHAGEPPIHLRELVPAHGPRAELRCPGHRLHRLKG